MISTTIRQQLLENVKNLPEYTQMVLQSFDWIGELEKIAIKYSLNADQEKGLVVETGLVLLELADPELLAVQLKTSTGINEQQLPKVCNDIIERVFQRYQKELDAIMGDAGVEMQAQLKQMYAESEALASTGLVLTDNAAVATTDTVASSDVKATMPAATGVAHYGSDPYHEPVE